MTEGAYCLCTKMCEYGNNFSNINIYVVSAQIKPKRKGGATCLPTHGRVHFRKIDTILYVLCVTNLIIIELLSIWERRV